LKADVCPQIQRDKNKNAAKLAEVWPEGALLNPSSKTLTFVDVQTAIDTYSCIGVPGAGKHLASRSGRGLPIKSFRKLVIKPLNANVVARPNKETCKRWNPWVSSCLWLSKDAAVIVIPGTIMAKS